MDERDDLNRWLDELLSEVPPRTTAPAKAEVAVAVDGVGADLWSDYIAVISAVLLLGREPSLAHRTRQLVEQYGLPVWDEIVDDLVARVASGDSNGPAHPPEVWREACQQAVARVCPYVASVALQKQVERLPSRSPRRPRL